mmetsp:Transcript_10080/g.37571  ORF Transcript_10080/g.37571 Transcript_10080/m.37571 type:complete len:182 (+) Transcript_10080:3153-3698(+)
MTRHEKLRNHISRAFTSISSVSVLANIPTIILSSIVYSQGSRGSNGECRTETLLYILLGVMIVSWANLLCSICSSCVSIVELCLLKRGSTMLSNILSVLFSFPLSLLNIAAMAVYTVFFFVVYDCEGTDLYKWSQIFIYVFWGIFVLQLAVTITCCAGIFSLSCLTSCFARDKKEKGTHGQ